ncbi:MAG: hypothetical protein Q4C96_07045 [Planctomycetia bacterium]|nr:hypothetical protein [Planctomycetia bacterium]
MPPFPTLGGIHFWSDVSFYHEWRIQYNSTLKIYRLLDPHSRQYALGTHDHCLKRLEKLKHTLSIPSLKGRVLILMHGLGANRLTMQRMAGWFRQRGNYSAVINITYTSTEMSVRQQAEKLASIIHGLKGAEKIDLVGHSLGSIIIRCYLGNPPGGEKGKLPDNRIQRFVQICPPNGGSQYAKTASQLHFSAKIGGPLHDLGRSYPEMLKEFGIPPCEFGIMAGGCNNEWGFTPLLDGDDDGVIPVSTTLLEGASDFILINGHHSLLPNMAETFEFIERFLENGYFRPSQKKKSITAANISDSH